MTMHQDIARVLIDSERIAARVAEMGREIAADITSQTQGNEAEVVLVPVLTGSIVFVADLIRHLPHKLRIGVVSVSSYPGRSRQSRGASMRGVLPDNLAGKHVLIIDDILDSGSTIRLLQEIIAEQQPATLRTCVFLRKERESARDINVDYVGFHIPDEFVVGYGLDYNDYYRNLPEIAILRPEAL